MPEESAQLLHVVISKLDGLKEDVEVLKRDSVRLSILEEAVTSVRRRVHDLYAFTNKAVETFAEHDSRFATLTERLVGLGERLTTLVQLREQVDDLRDQVTRHDEQLREARRAGAIAGTVMGGGSGLVAWILQNLLGG